MASVCAEASDVDGCAEFAELADFLEVLVHLLVGDDGKGQVSGKILVFVFVQDGLGVGVEFDLEAGVGLLGDYGDGSVLDVVPVEVGHVGVAEDGEDTEAEEVAALRLDLFELWKAAIAGTGY